MRLAAHLKDGEKASDALKHFLKQGFYAFLPRTAFSPQGVQLLFAGASKADAGPQSEKRKRQQDAGDQRAGNETVYRVADHEDQRRADGKADDPAHALFALGIRTGGDLRLAQ